MEAGPWATVSQRTYRGWRQLSMTLDLTTRKTPQKIPLEIPTLTTWVASVTFGPSNLSNFRHTGELDEVWVRGCVFGLLSILRCDRSPSNSIRSEVVHMERDLIALIKEKQATLSKVQRELDEARALLEDGRRILDEERAKPTRKGRLGVRTAIPKRTPVVVKSRSSVGKAQKALQKAGHPLLIDDLLSQINKGRKKVKRTTLVGNLSRYVKMGVIFSRPARSTFALLAWEKAGDGKEASKRTPVRPEAA